MKVFLRNFAVFSYNYTNSSGLNIGRVRSFDIGIKEGRNISASSLRSVSYHQPGCRLCLVPLRTSARIIIKQFQALVSFKLLHERRVGAVVPVGIELLVPEADPVGVAYVASVVDV